MSFVSDEEDCPIIPRWTGSVITVISRDEPMLILVQNENGKFIRLALEDFPADREISVGGINIVLNQAKQIISTSYSINKADFE